MSFKHGKAIVDTNVPLVANCSLDPDGISEDMIGCVGACIEAIDNLTKKGTLVLDFGGEILKEYFNKLSRKGQPGIGDRFAKWAYDNQGNHKLVETVVITIDGDSYREFPKSEGLSRFDRSDRKFVAVANAHPGKPPVIQAADSKWWGWKDDLKQAGVKVDFICPEYVKEKYKKQEK